MGDLNPLTELRERLLAHSYWDDRERDLISADFDAFAAEHPELGVTCGECQHDRPGFMMCEKRVGRAEAIDTELFSCSLARPKQEEG